MTYFESILKVLVIGLVLGAGLPAVFAGGLVAYSNGAGATEADGTVHASNPVVEVPRDCAVRICRLGDHHRGLLDHQDHDHSPFRYRPVPLHAHEVT